ATRGRCTIAGTSDSAWKSLRTETMRRAGNVPSSNPRATDCGSVTRNINRLGIASTAWVPTAAAMAAAASPPPRKLSAAVGRNNVASPHSPSSVSRPPTDPLPLAPLAFVTTVALLVGRWFGWKRSRRQGPMRPPTNPSVIPARPVSLLSAAASVNIDAAEADAAFAIPLPPPATKA
ncbi:hypothetical protein Vretimale_15401, partial [Volvox reticuliferus]